MVFQNEILAGSSGSSASSVYKIDQSIRFNDDDSAYMYRTPSQASSSQRAWSISFWTKRGNLTSGNRGLFAWEGVNDNQEVRLYFDDDVLHWSYYSDGYICRAITNRLFRDVSAWYHILVVSDTENSNSSDRWRMYINGVRETSFSATTFPSQNTNIAIFSSTSYKTTIGRSRSSSASTYDGYIAEINVLDGYAYDPSYFGETNENGIWVPKEYTGSYGTNGFYIKGADASSLGADSSGNGNNFTTSGLASHDQVADSPSNSFCTINTVADINSTQNTISEGNLKSAGSSSLIWHISPCTHILPSGKWYFEGRLNTTINASRFAIGLIPTSPMLPANYGNLPSSVVNSSGFSLQLDSNTAGLLWYAYSGSGQYVTISVDTDNVGTIGQFAIDVDNQKIWAGINGTYYNSSGGGDGNPSTGSNPTYSGTSNFSTKPLVPFIGNYYNSCQGVLNFGQDGTFAGTETAQGNSDGNGIGNFKYSVPSGFKAICTKNLGS